MPGNLDISRWQNLSFAAQIGNIGSELSRAASLGEKGDLQGSKNSLERSLELLDASAVSARGLSRRSEILRLRELVADKYADTRIYYDSMRALSNFCLPFAVVARSKWID